MEPTWQNENPVKLSAYMITFNNERTVEKALHSLTGLVDEIVVVDSFSTDRTLEIARRYTNRVEQRAWPGFRDQYQYAAEQCINGWVLFIDADEEISPELAKEIRQELAANAQRPPSEQIAGYYAPRRTWYLGRWIEHGGWVPDREIRVYHADQGRWEGGLHANVKVKGKIDQFRNIYRHYTYADIADHLKTINNYSATAAQDMHAAGKRASLLKMLTSPPGRFLRDYFIKRGFLDGFPGLVIALSTMFYVFIKHAKLWELQHRDTFQVPGQ